MTVKAYGKMLQRVSFLKGKQGGWISTEEISPFPSEIIFSCKFGECMNISVMLMWVDKVLKPYMFLSDRHLLF